MNSSSSNLTLERDEEKWNLVFRMNHATADNLARDIPDFQAAALRVVTQSVRAVPRRHELGGGYDPQRRGKPCSYPFLVPVSGGATLNKFGPFGGSFRKLETARLG